MGVSALCSSFSIWGPHGEVVGCETAVRAPAPILLVFGGGGVFFNFFFSPKSQQFFQRILPGTQMELENVNQRIHNLLV